jgi:hypothetical protein
VPSVVFSGESAESFAPVDAHADRITSAMQVAYRIHLDGFMMIQLSPLLRPTPR